MHHDAAKLAELYMEERAEPLRCISLGLPLCSKDDLFKEAKKVPAVADTNKSKRNKSKARVEVSGAQKQKDDELAAAVAQSETLGGGAPPNILRVAVGAKIRSFWSGDGHWYEAVVTASQLRGGRVWWHEVEWDNKDREWIRFDDHKSIVEVVCKAPVPKSASSDASQEGGKKRGDDGTKKGSPRKKVRSQKPKSENGSEEQLPPEQLEAQLQIQAQERQRQLQQLSLAQQLSAAAAASGLMPANVQKVKALVPAELEKSEEARRAAQTKAKKEAEEKAGLARKAAEDQARKVAEEQARLQAEERARQEAEEARAAEEAKAAEEKNALRSTVANSELLETWSSEDDEEEDATDDDEEGSSGDDSKDGDEDDKKKDEVMEEAPEEAAEENAEVDGTEEAPYDGPLGDTYISSGSLMAALTASGVVCRAVDMVNSLHYLRKGQASNIEPQAASSTPKRLGTNAFCCVRPPGHHSGRDGMTKHCCSTGFCLLNNVALGVVHARLKWGIKRIAVVDLDVHFGNGTAQIFANDPDVFFASVHMQQTGDGAPFFPFPEGSEHDVTKPCDSQLMVQVLPQAVADEFPERLAGRKGFLRGVAEVIMPQLKAFRPEMIFISAGFDGCNTDPLGNELGLEAVDFHAATTMLVSASETEPLCGGRLVSVLEGGYDVAGETVAESGLAHCAKAHVLALMGDPPPPREHRVVKQDEDE
jgi:acetoin utilization deacetylase AcuC-like enzyme